VWRLSQTESASLVECQYAEGSCRVMAGGLCTAQQHICCSGFAAERWCQQGHACSNVEHAALCTMISTIPVLSPFFLCQYSHHSRAY
jgi:hypothetical protein